MTERQLFRLVAGKQTGPYAPEKLRPLIADGRISRLDRFSYDGVDWLPADHFPALMTSGAPSTTPSGSASIPSGTSTPAVVLPDHNVLATSVAPPPFVPPIPNTAAARGALPLRRVLIAGISIALLVTLAAVAFVMNNGFSATSSDVTDEFDVLAKAVGAYAGKSVLVRGTYYPQDLQPRASGRQYTIKFRSMGTKKALVSGDRTDRLTLVLPDAMGSRLMQIIGRLQSEQPAVIHFTCQDQDGGTNRPLGVVTKMCFFHELPQSVKDKSFLQMGEDGEIEED